MTAVRSAPADPAPLTALQGFGPPPPPRRPRNLAGALLGLLLIVFCASAVALYASNVGHRRAVLVIVRPVKAGAVIHAADLGEVRISADPGVHSVPTSQRDHIVGQVAGVALVPGTLVTRAELGGGSRVGPGQVVVGVALKSGQFPAGLRAPDQVMVVETGPAPDNATGTTITGPSPTVLDPRSEVFSVDPAPDGQTTVVSLLTAEGSAPQIAQAGARGEVSVLLVGGPG